jgi:hypothetical protein
MKRQLEDFEAAQSAEIQIQELSGDPMIGSNGYSHITFTIANVGQTKAEDINLGEDSSIWPVPSGLLMPDQSAKIAAKITPVPSRNNGSSLGAGKSKKYDVDGARIDALLKEKADHSFTVLVGYKDVFGHEKWVGDCILFVYMMRAYIPCGTPHN